jgi:hypothetical protein
MFGRRATFFSCFFVQQAHAYNSPQFMFYANHEKQGKILGEEATTAGVLSGSQACHLITNHSGKPDALFYSSAPFPPSNPIFSLQESGASLPPSDPYHSRSHGLLLARPPASLTRTVGPPPSCSPAGPPPILPQLISAPSARHRYPPAATYLRFFLP